MKLVFVFLHVLLEHFLKPSLRAYLVFFALSAVAYVWITLAERRVRRRQGGDGVFG